MQCNRVLGTTAVTDEKTQYMRIRATRSTGTRQLPDDPAGRGPETTINVSTIVGSPARAGRVLARGEEAGGQRPGAVHQNAPVHRRQERAACRPKPDGARAAGSKGE